MDPLNRYLFHPLARRIALWIRPTGLSPNAVSAVSAGVVAAAALAYAGLDWPLSVLIGFTLHLSWHVFDGADGELARLTGQVSPLGELVDGAADYTGHTFLYFVLAWVLSGSIGHWAWPLVLLSGFSRVAQSNMPNQRRTYLWRVHACLAETRQASDANCSSARA